MEQHVQRIDPNLFFKFEKYMTEDAEKLAHLVENGLLTPNEASKRLGLPFDDNDPDRNTYYFSGQRFPIGFLNLPTESSVEADKSNSVIDVKHECKSHNNDVDLMDPKNIDAIVEHFDKSATRPKRFQKDYIQRALLTRVSLEDRYTVVYSKYFDDQSDRVIKRFEGEYKNISTLSRKVIAKKLLSKLDDELILHDAKGHYEFKALEDEDITKVVGLLMPEGEDEQLLVVSQALHTSGLQRSIGDINNINGTFVNQNLSNPFVKSALKKLGKDVTRVNDFTRARLAKTIINGIDKGKTVSEISTDIEDKFKSWSGFRARRIARTESRLAWDAGAKIAYKELDVPAVDVVGCGGLSVLAGGDEPVEIGRCGVQDTPIAKMDSLFFHPNHIGVIAPSKEIG